MSINSHEWLLGLHAGYAVTEEWLEHHYIPTVKALMNERDKLLAVVEAAEAVLDEADPRKYGDMTAKQSDLADKLVVLHENSVTE